MYTRSFDRVRFPASELKSAVTSHYSEDKTSKFSWPLKHIMTWGLPFLALCSLQFFLMHNAPFRSFFEYERDETNVIATS